MHMKYFLKVQPINQNFFFQSNQLSDVKIKEDVQCFIKIDKKISLTINLKKKTVEQVFVKN